MRVRNAHFAAKNVVKPYWFICVNWHFLVVCWNRNIENSSKIKKQQQTFAYAVVVVVVSGQKKTFSNFVWKPFCCHTFLILFIVFKKNTKNKEFKRSVCRQNEEKYNTTFQTSRFCLHLYIRMHSSACHMLHSIWSSIVRMTEMRVPDNELKYVFDYICVCVRYAFRDRFST